MHYRIHARDERRPVCATHIWQSAIFGTAANGRAAACSPDAHARVQQGGDEMRPNESGRAGDENVHRASRIKDSSKTATHADPAASMAACASGAAQPAVNDSPQRATLQAPTRARIDQLDCPRSSAFW